MKSKSEVKTKRKGKGKMVWIIVFSVIAVMGIGSSILWLRVSKEHNEAKNLPIAVINFRELNDGIYIGEYKGGMYKWRANKVQVKVTSGKVTDIELLNSSDPAAKLGNMDQASLYDKVIKKQTLQVDTISGATLTSKAYLKSVENALGKAQRK